ncbi:MAG TPA: DnaB-like helicase C-terminal domain-containing protein [Melioribacteraceae bacterium]|nr:DnaB-like helicase C-terminal domain-containing protein [Melioribacteraceae bacterium]
MEKLEQTILGEFLSLNIYQDQVDVMLELNTGLFKGEKAKKLVEAFSKILFEKRHVIDAVSVYKEVVNIPGIEVVDLAELVRGSCPINEIFHHIEILKERKYRRDIERNVLDSLDELKTSVTINEFNDKKEKLIVALSGIEFNSNTKLVDPLQHIKKLDEHLGKNKVLEGASWGLIDLDVYTNGIETPRLIVLGGLKKSGKTKFVINTRYQLYKQKIHSPFISLEMPGYEITKQTISRFSEIPEPYFRARSYMSNDQKKIYDRVKQEIDWSLLPVMDKSGVDAYQIVAMIRYFSKQYPGCIIFIDYLQRVKHDRNKQAQELEKISNMIADATREYNVSVVLLSQLNNSAEWTDPSIGTLKGSGGIGESADTIILLDNLYRREKIDSNRGIIKLHLEQRYGDSGTIRINSDLSINKFFDSELTPGTNEIHARNYYESEVEELKI